MTKNTWILLLSVALFLSVGCKAKVEPNSPKTSDVIVKKVPDDMVLIPAGEFLMGSTPEQVNYGVQLCNKYNNNKCDKGWLAQEQPQHQVYLDAYYIDIHEVTVAQYNVCVNAGKCLPPKTADSCNWGVAGRENHPINCVDWSQAKGYCEFEGKRMPTEAEWEKAARGTDGRLFPWGNDWNSTNAISKVNGKKNLSTSPVGSFLGGASPYGVMDMTGNIWEWVADWYADNYYKNSPSRNPTGPASGEDRVVRGGAWFVDPFPLRSAYRFGINPAKQHSGNGIRCAGTP